MYHFMFECDMVLFVIVVVVVVVVVSSESVLVKGHCMYFYI